MGRIHGILHLAYQYSFMDHVKDGYIFGITRLIFTYSLIYLVVDGVRKEKERLTAVSNYKRKCYPYTSKSNSEFNWQSINFRHSLINNKYTITYGYQPSLWTVNKYSSLDVTWLAENCCKE